MAVILILVVIFTGSLIALQGVVNAYLGQGIGNPLHAGIISFGVGFIFLCILAVIQREPIAVDQLIHLPKIAFIGGLLGAVYVVSAIFIVPKIGIASTVIAALFGQMVLSVILDHFGFLNLEVDRISFRKCVGIALVLLGVTLVNLDKLKSSF